MPTITIAAESATASQRRAVAAGLTRHLKDRGVVPSHVVVAFTEIEPATVFTAAVPVEATTVDGAAPVLVTCCIGLDRDDSFRSELAARIQDLVGQHLRAGWTQVQFIPTDPRNVYLGSAATPISSADRLGPGTDPAPQPAP